VSEILYPQSDFPDMLFDPKMFAVIARPVIIMFVFCLKYRRSSTFVQPAFSYIIISDPLTRLSFSEFGLSYTADEQTLRAL